VYDFTVEGQPNAVLDSGVIVHNCTLTLQFMLREDRLHVIACMRSSDVWLGLPYDAFNFSMLGNILASQLGVALGTVTFHLGSSHLYETNLDAAKKVLESGEELMDVSSPALPGAPPACLETVLENQDAESFQDAEPWASYALVLAAVTNSQALAHLLTIEPKEEV